MEANASYTSSTGVPSSVWGDFLQEYRLVEAVRHPSSCVATSRAWMPIAPGSLTYSIGAVPSTVHSALFQKSNGNFFLVLWNEVASFDRHRHVTLNPEPVNATLTLVSTPSVLVFHLPTLGRTTKPDLSQTVPIQIPDHPLIIEIGFSGAPSSVPSATTDPNPPSTPVTPAPPNSQVHLGQVPYHRDSTVTQNARLPLAHLATVR